MKIIMSKAVMAESNLVGQQICRALEFPAKDLSADEVMQSCVAATAELQNVRYEIVGDELHCIIDDKLILATLRIYGKVAHYAKALEEQLELYAAENSSLRAAGFENAQDLFTSYQGLEKQLAAVQLQIQQYREALSGLLQDDGAIAFFAPMNVAKAYAALALPADTALEAIVEKAGEVMRERSATVCDKRSTYYGRASAESQEAKDCAFNIRAFPPVKLDDLK